MLYRVVIFFSFVVLFSACTGTLVEPPEVVFSDNTLLGNQSKTNVIKGDYLYQLREERVLIYEILANNDKVVVNSFPAVSATELELFEDYLGVIMVFEDSKKVVMYDLTLPSSPRNEQTIDIGICQNVAIVDGVYYLTQNNNCLASNEPTAGLIIVEYKYARKNTPFITDQSFDITSYKNYIYTAADNRGIVVYDATDSVNLIETNRIDIPTKNIAIENNWLHAKDESSIHHFDISDPANPTLAGKTSIE